MSNSKMTKRALLTSIMALMLCFAMLTGTTFAWFTDQETSGNNKIIAGNLDVQLLMFNGTEYEDIGETQTPIFGNENSLIAQNNNANTLWEPGKTQIAYLAIRNAGNLALKYNVIVDVKDAGLANALEYAIIPMADAVTSFTPPAADWTTIKGTAGVDSGDLKNGRFIAAPDGCLDEVRNGYDPNNLETDYFALAIHMKEDAGNEYMFKSVTIDITVTATQVAAEADSFDEKYDEDAIFADTPVSMQTALDNAVPGTTIQLTPGVDYGTLYLRPSSNEGVTKKVDWVGNNYGYETYSLFKDITIIGAEGATVDAIEIEGGTYYNTEHSQADTYPVMLSLIELNNVIIDGVTFTGKGGYDPQGYGNVINLSGNNIKVDGLTLKNCVLENELNDARLIYKTESTTSVHTYTYDGADYTFVPSLKDITVTGCTLNGGYIGLELRETENVTITNNEFNVADRNILLPTNTGYTYSGTITITGNVSNDAKERFVRADGTGDAAVIIKDNTVNDYMGADDDYIKVTNANNVTIENNTMNRKFLVADADSLKSALANGGKIVLVNNITVTDRLEMKKSCTIDLSGKTLYINATDDSYISNAANVTIKNGDIDISGTDFDEHNGIFNFGGNTAGGNTLTLENVNFYGDGFNSYSVFWIAKSLDGQTPNTLNLVDSKFELKNLADIGGFIKHPSGVENCSSINITNTDIDIENGARLFLYGVYNIKDSEISFVDTTGEANGLRQGQFTIDNSKITISGGDKGISPRYADTVIKNGSVVTINNVKGNDVIFEYDYDIRVDSSSTFTYNTTSGTGSVIVG